MGLGLPWGLILETLNIQRCIDYPNVRFMIELMKKTSKPDVNEAASALGKRSAEVRQKAWGEERIQEAHEGMGQARRTPKEI